MWLYRTIPAIAAVLMTATAHAFPVATTSDLNLRSGPGPGNPAMAVMPRGEVVHIDYCQGTWCRVFFRGSPGWASANHLALLPGRPFAWEGGDRAISAFPLDRPPRGAVVARALPDPARRSGRFDEPYVVPLEGPFDDPVVGSSDDPYVVPLEGPFGEPTDRRRPAPAIIPATPNSGRSAALAPTRDIPTPPRRPALGEPDVAAPAVPEPDNAVSSLPEPTVVEPPRPAAVLPEAPLPERRGPEPAAAESPVAEPVAPPRAAVVAEPPVEGYRVGPSGAGGREVL